MQSDVDTSGRETTDRPGDTPRTTPPSAPTSPASGSAVSSGPAGASPSPSTVPPTPEQRRAPGSTPSGTPASSTPGSNSAGASTAGSSAAGSSTAGASTSASAAGTGPEGTGLVPAARPGGNNTLNSGPQPASPARPDMQSLLDPEYAASVRERWFGVQSAFVDDPESAVREASAVLEDSIAAIGRGLEKLRRSVTDSAESADGTEDLRVALLRHREVVGRLLQM